MNYKESGVSIKEGDRVSQILYDCALETWKNKKDKLRNVIVPYDDFTGIRCIDISNLSKDTVMNINFDGIGTKVSMIERYRDYRTLAFDLFAMVCDDAAAIGAEPVLIGSILDVDYIGTYNRHRINELAWGYIEAANAANVVIVNGEVAELGDRIKGESCVLNLNWGAACVWFARKNKLIDRSNIEEDDYLVGLREYGFRSNGYSLVKKILDNKHKGKFPYWFVPGEIIQPSTIYTKAIVEMTGGYYNKPYAIINGIAHITGGGLYGKVKRMLKPTGLSATIDNPFDPPEIMHECQRDGRVSDKEAYRTWNMGQGMVIATPEPVRVIEVAKKHKLEAQIIGKVTKNDRIRILNKGFFTRTDFLEYML